MSDLIDKGLEALETQRKGKPVATAKGSPITVSALHDLARRVQRARRRHSERARAVNDHMAVWREKREVALKSLPRNLRADAIKAEESAEREKALAIYVDDFIKHRATILLADQSAKATARLFKDPVAFIDTETLGNGRRSSFDRQLQDAEKAPARIAYAFLKADATQDADLYAATHAKFGNMSKAEKAGVESRVNPRDIATTLRGEQLQAAAGMLAAIEYHAADVQREADILAGKTLSSDTKIRVGALQMTAKSLQIDGADYLDIDKEPSEPEVVPDWVPRGTFSP